MKVILIQDVAKIGRKNDIVNVPDGYAQNQLIPKGWVKPATAENLKLIKQKNYLNANREQGEEEAFFKVKKQLDGQVIKITGQKNDNGHLFAALKPESVIAAAAEMDIALNKNMLDIKEPIKTTGQHSIELVQGKHKDAITIEIQ